MTRGKSITWTENILRQQADDAFCFRQNPGTYRSKSEFFLDEDGLMYKPSSKGNHQLVVPATLTRKVVRQNHDPVYGARYIAHLDIKKTYDLIAVRYWLSGVRKTIGSNVKNCSRCQRTPNIED